MRVKPWSVRRRKKAEWVSFTARFSSRASTRFSARALFKRALASKREAKRSFILQICKRKENLMNITVFFYLYNIYAPVSNELNKTKN